MKPHRIRQAVQRLTPYTPGEQPASADPVIKLNTNENPYPPSPRVAAALAEATADALRLYPDPLCLPLRRRIADRHGTTVEQVFVGNGSDEILALSLRAFVERSGAVGYFEPSYSLYPVLAAIEEIETRPVALAEDFGWSMPDGYAASLFYLCTPNAPTSLSFPRDRVASFCQSFPGVVLLDEAYADFADRNDLDLALHLPNVLAARSLSKAYSLAGLRLGYAVGPAPLIDALYRIKDSYNVSRLAQALGLAALDDVDCLRKNVERIRATRARVARALTDRGWRVFPSQTNFLWARPGAAPAPALFAALRARRILVRHFPGPRTGDYLRISIGADPDMDRFLQALDDLSSRPGA